MNIKENIKENISLKGHYKFTLTDINTGKQEVFEYTNVVPSAAWEMIANHFASPVPDNSMHLMEAALGTGTDAPDVEDAGLQAEVYRNNLVSKSNAANIVYATAYFNASETSGTFKEAGIFTEDNIMVSHVAINVVKTLTQTFTLDFQLIIGA